MAEYSAQEKSDLSSASVESLRRTLNSNQVRCSFAILGCIFLCTLAIRVYRVSSTESKLKELHAEYVWSHDLLSPQTNNPPSKTSQLLAKYLGNTVVSDISSVKVGEGKDVSEKQLEVLSGMRRLQAIEINCNAATDRTLALLGALPNLRHLTLAGDQFSVMGLLELRHSSNLRRLTIDTSILTPVELAVLKSELHDVQLDDITATQLAASLGRESGSNLEKTPHLMEVTLPDLGGFLPSNPTL
ncbi:MAG: hypothetical protein ACE361_01855 [Aureliella sp.]